MALYVHLHANFIVLFRVSRCCMATDDSAVRLGHRRNHDRDAAVASICYAES